MNSHLYIPLLFFNLIYNQAFANQEQKRMPETRDSRISTKVTRRRLKTTITAVKRWLNNNSTQCLKIIPKNLLFTTLRAKRALPFFFQLQNQHFLSQIPIFFLNKHQNFCPMKFQWDFFFQLWNTVLYHSWRIRSRVVVSLARNFPPFLVHATQMSKWSLSEVHDYSTIRLWVMSQFYLHTRNHLYWWCWWDEKRCQVVKLKKKQAPLLSEFTF